MTRFFIALVGLIIASAAFAQSPGSSWTYYGLPNGPTIRSLDKSEEYGTPFYLRKSKCAPTVMVYTPHVTLAEQPQPKKLILGWHTFSSPSPRPTPSVAVTP
jgi:hypothetical protein